MHNYNDVVSALVTPATDGTPGGSLDKLPFHAGELAKMPLRALRRAALHPRQGRRRLHCGGK